MASPQPAVKTTEGLPKNASTQESPRTNQNHGHALDKKDGPVAKRAGPIQGGQVGEASVQGFSGDEPEASQTSENTFNMSLK